MDPSKDHLQENTIDHDYRRLGHAITPQQSGIRIDAYLGRVFRFRSRAQWNQTCRKQQVRVNTRNVKPDYRLRTGDLLDYYCPESLEPPVTRTLANVWQEGDLLVVNKPAGLPMHEGGAYRYATFAVALQEQYGKDWAAIHRLDRETSGLVLCARTPDLRRDLSLMLYERKICKRYLALVQGRPPQKSWCEKAPIGPADTTLFRTKQWVHTQEAREALTEFVLVETCKNASLIEAFPKTGRTHQIRVHAAYARLPLVGDKKYTPDETVGIEYLEQGFTPRVAQAVWSERLCLHAAGLSFLHPVTGAKLQISSSMPQDMQDIWKQLKENTESP